MVWWASSSSWTSSWCSPELSPVFGEWKVGYSCFHWRHSLEKPTGPPQWTCLSSYSEEKESDRSPGSRPAENRAVPVKRIVSEDITFMCSMKKMRELIAGLASMTGLWTIVLHSRYFSTSFRSRPLRPWLFNISKPAASPNISWLLQDLCCKNCFSILLRCSWVSWSGQVNLFYDDVEASKALNDKGNAFAVNYFLQFANIFFWENSWWSIMNESTNFSGYSDDHSGESCKHDCSISVRRFSLCLSSIK